jgi:hypothetical protein
VDHLREFMSRRRGQERIARLGIVHQPCDPREQLHVKTAGCGRGEDEKGDPHGRVIERDVVGDTVDYAGGESHFGNEIGAAVRNGQAAAQRRADLSLSRFYGVENAVHDSFIGVADGQTNEFAQKAGFGVAAERNAYMFRWKQLAEQQRKLR